MSASVYASLYLHLHTMIILRRIRAAVRIAPADPSERTELVQNIHDGHLRARQVLGHGVPNHQILQVLAQIAALRRLQVVHQREDALALRRVNRDE